MNRHSLPASSSTVVIESASGSTLRGWFARGRAGAGAVVLPHGVDARVLASVYPTIELAAADRLRVGLDTAATRD